MECLFKGRGQPVDPAAEVDGPVARTGVEAQATQGGVQRNARAPAWRSRKSIAALIVAAGPVMDTGQLWDLLFRPSLTNCL